MNSINLTPGVNRAILSLVDSVNELSSIMSRLGWWSLFWMVFFGVSFWYTQFRKNPNRINESEMFNSENADGLFLKGEIKELLAYCDKFEAKYPNDISIYWYRGIGHYNLGDLEESKMSFEQVTRINPAWTQQVEAYLEAINKYTESSGRH